MSSVDATTLGSFTDPIIILEVMGSLENPIVVEETVGIVIDPYAMKQVIYVVSSGGVYLISADPQISPGRYIGQELLVYGTSDDDAFAFAVGKGVFAGNAAITGLFNANCVLTLTWTGLLWANIPNANVVLLED